MIILFGGKEYAVGLTWFSISSPAEIDQFKREMDMTLGVTKMSKVEDEPSSVALAPNEYVNQVSLAAAISYAHENLLYVCKTDYKDEAGRLLYYLCCVKRGKVTVDGDTIADLDTIQSLYAQSLMDLRTDVPEDSIECLGTDVDDDRFEGAQPIDVTQMTTSIQRFESQCVIKELKKEGPSKVKMGVMAALIVATCFMAYLFFKPAPPPPVKVPVTPVAHKPAPIDPFTQLLNSIQMNSMITLPGLTMVMHAVKTIPMVLDGWTVTDINVNLGATTTFNVMLTRNPYGTVATLKALEKAGTLKNVSIDPKGDQAKAVWGAELKDVPVMTKEAIEAIKNEKTPEHQWAFMTLIQSKAMAVTLEVPTNVAGFGVQKFSCKNVGLWGIGGFADVFNEMKTMGITSIHIAPAKGAYQWDLQGVIYG
ncbi:MAG: hypothetical protein ACHQAX_03440 [Gammaproteobacteria bacterium]